MPVLTWALLLTVHPRVCGELALAAGIVGVLAGSSPRVRGTLLAERLGNAGQRFIPACAGNSAMRCR